MCSSVYSKQIWGFSRLSQISEVGICQSCIHLFDVPAVWRDLFIMVFNYSTSWSILAGIIGFHQMNRQAMKTWYSEQMWMYSYYNAQNFWATSLYNLSPVAPLHSNFRLCWSLPAFCFKTLMKLPYIFYQHSQLFLLMTHPFMYWFRHDLVSAQLLFLIIKWLG